MRQADKRNGNSNDARWSWAIWLTGLGLLSLYTITILDGHGRVLCAGDISAYDHALALLDLSLKEQLASLKDYWYPPGYDLQLAAVFRLAGVGLRAFIPLNLLQFAILFAAAVALLRRLVSAEAGLVAGVLVLLAPMGPLLSRYALRDVGIIGFVSATVWFLVRMETTPRMRHAVLLGLAAGCAMMVKWTAVVFLVPAVAIQLWSQVKLNSNELRRRLPLWLVATGIFLAVVLPWHLFASVVGELGEKVLEEPMLEDLPYGAMLPAQVVRFFLGWPLSVMVVLALGRLLITKRWRRYALLFSLPALLPILAFEFLPYPQPRHIAAGLPLLVLLIPLALYGAMPRIVARIASLGLIGYLLIAFVLVQRGALPNVDPAGTPIPSNPQCLDYFPAVCEAVDDAARVTASSRRLHREVRVVIDPWSPVEDTSAICDDSMDLCARLHNRPDFIRTWSFLEVTDTPDHQLPDLNTLDVWIEISREGETLPPQKSGFVRQALIPADCVREIAVWRREAVD